MKIKKLITIFLTAALVLGVTACSTANAGSSEQAFPTFEGQDLNGNKVDSSLFNKNSVTVVNFWFSSCEACVSELGHLNELNETLKEKGGAVIGVNTDTFGGQTQAIEEAKSILANKDANYTNVWVDTDSKLADFTKNFFAYPITYVVDGNGNIVDKPLLGGIDNPSVMDALQKQIDKAVSQEKK